MRSLFWDEFLNLLIWFMIPSSLRIIFICPTLTFPAIIWPGDPDLVNFQLMTTSVTINILLHLFTTRDSNAIAIGANLFTTRDSNAIAIGANYRGTFIVQVYIGLIDENTFGREYTYMTITGTRKKFNWTIISISKNVALVWNLNLKIWIKQR